MSLENKISPEEEKKLKPKISFDTKSLLDDLARKIAQEYGIDVSKVKEFINSKTGGELSSLKSLLNSKTGQEINLEELKTVISGAKNVIEKASKDEIELLKWSIESLGFSPKDDFYITEKLFSQELHQRAKNPKSMWDNMIWAGIGIMNSAESTVQLLYKIGAGIVSIPYHIYLVFSGKWEYENWKRV